MIPKKISPLNAELLDKFMEENEDMFEVIKEWN
jgi:hypothetical protein